jgi:hypothetical protein
MERTWPLRWKVSEVCAQMSRCCVDLRLGRVGVEVNALQVEDVVLGVGAVVQRVVAGDGQRVVKGDCLAAEDGACRGRGGEERGGDVEELHLVVFGVVCLSVDVQLGQEWRLGLCLCRQPVWSADSPATSSRIGPVTDVSALPSSDL